ncbi:MAG: hypothetical protein ACKODX_05370 [Gemmata sp.]
MPVLTRPLDTTAPGSMRRKVWSQPELKSHSLLVLTPARLVVAPLAGSLKPAVVAAAETADLDTLLGPLAVAVDLPAVCALKLDLLTNSLTVEYGPADASSRTKRLALVFATPESADGCFAKLWRRLGDGYQLRPYARDTWALARAPVAVLGAVLLATAALALGISAYEDGASERAAARPDTSAASKGAPGGLDWRAVCAAGGAAAGASQVWLYRRLTSPPQALEVTRA